MRGRWWLLLIYALLAAGLCLATGNLWWLLWAVPIALVVTGLVVVTGLGREWTARRRLREFSKLADRIGARDGEVLWEKRRRYYVIAFDPGLCVITLRPGTEEEVRAVFRPKVAEAGFRGGDSWSLHSDDFRLSLRISFPGKFLTGDRWEPAPDGFVVTEVQIEAWKGGRPGDKPVMRRR